MQISCVYVVIVLGNQCAMSHTEQHEICSVLSCEPVLDKVFRQTERQQMWVILGLNGAAASLLACPLLATLGWAGN